MDTYQAVPLDTESANYREWVATVDAGTYCIVQEGETWTVLQYNEATQQWEDTPEQVDTFLDTHHLLLLEGDTLMSEPRMEPMIGYDFRADGRYDTKHYLENAHALNAFMGTNVVRAFMEGREAMVTDADDHTVFHVKAGKVEWAGGGDTAAMTSTLRAIGVTQNDLKGRLKDALSTSKQPTDFRHVPSEFRGGLER